MIKFKLEEFQIGSYSNDNAENSNLIWIKYKLRMFQGSFDSMSELTKPS